MPKYPTISVCIPVFNGGEFIKDSIESVLNQTYSDFELIIIDNNSTDNTVKIVRSFTDPRIRLMVNATNIGFEGNWNRCLSEVRGRYFKILPADDILHRECLEKQVNAFSESDELVFVCCNKIIIDKTGSELFRVVRQKKKTCLDKRMLLKRIIRSGTNYIGEPGSVLVRASVLKKNIRFSARYSYVIDLDFWVTLIDEGKALFLPDVLCAFRISDSSTSVNILRKQCRDVGEFFVFLFRSNRNIISRYDLLVGLIQIRIAGMMRRLVYFLFLK